MANMNQEGKNISVGFQPVPPQLIDTIAVRWRQGLFNLMFPKWKNQNLALDQILILQILTLKMNWTGYLSS